MPRLRCLVGPSSSELVEISVNSLGGHHHIKSELFEGDVAVFMRMTGDDDSPPEYFQRPERKGVTWSIQVQGRFLQSHSADDILFGNTFDRPLQLPWGSGVALRFMSLIDPALEHDLTGPEPWALSPLLATMPYARHEKTLDGDLPAFRVDQSVTESCEDLESTKEIPIDLFRSPAGRRSWMSNAENRKSVALGHEDVLATDFCYGFLRFPELYLMLPGGVSFDLNRYWDGQPVRFVCCERGAPGTPVNEYKMFWCVVFERVEDSDEEREDAEVPSDVD